MALPPSVGLFNSCTYFSKGDNIMAKNDTIAPVKTNESKPEASVSTEPNFDQKYTVLHKMVGGFPQKNEDGSDFVFTESTFRRLNPTPDDWKPEKAEQYYADAIKRLLDLKAITPAPVNAVESTPPLSPFFDGEKNPAGWRKPEMNEHAKAIKEAIRDGLKELVVA
jgi:hypothetical protein